MAFVELSSRRGAEDAEKGAQLSKRGLRSFSPELAKLRKKEGTNDKLPNNGSASSAPLRELKTQ